jgi:hypothetical protein
MAARWHHPDAGFPVGVPAGPRSEEGGTTISREATANSIDARLRQAGRKIDEIVTAVRHANHRGGSRVSRRIDRLRASEGQARASLRELRGADRIAWDEHLGELERRLGELAIEMTIAEARLTAELAPDAVGFAAAVETELIAWNAFIDNLQAIAATTGEHARQQREAVIRRVRQRRASVRQQLHEFRDASGCRPVIPRTQVGEALDHLDRAAGEAVAEFGITRW